MCLSRQRHRDYYYDDETSRHFNRSRIETELVNLLVDEDESCSTSDVEFSSESSQHMIIFTNEKSQQSCSIRHGIETSTNVKKIESANRRREFINNRYSFIHSRNKDYRPLKTRDMKEDVNDSFISEFFENDEKDDGSLFDLLMLSTDLDSMDDFDMCSQISYESDSDTDASSIDFFLSGNKREMREEGLSVAEESQFVEKKQDIDLESRTFSLLSSRINNDSAYSFSLNNGVEMEPESQSVIVASKGSSKYTTDSPKILELRERKRLMERHHEKKYSRFPALIEVDINASHEFLGDI